MKNPFPAIVLIPILAATAFCQQSDVSLRRVIEQDRSNRNTSGKLETLSASEHLARAEVYFANRQFPQAREHWQKIVDHYPTDAGMPGTLFGIARSHMWEREYEKAVEWFGRLTKMFIETKDGREGLAFLGASYVRLGKNIEAARTYQQYVAMFPTGERIETSHLNIIDALREAEMYSEADQWIDKTRQRFAGMPVETNALHARLRMNIFRENWNEAVKTADSLLMLNKFSGSMTSADEIKYLKAFSLEKAGRKQQAMDTYGSIPNSLGSYWGGRASERLAVNGAKMHIPKPPTAKQIADSPAPYRAELLRYAKAKKIDPRFVLAIMKQESSFRPDAKSPAAARGLLQIVYDTALKYKNEAGFPNLQGDDLYAPSVNIAIGTAYIEDLLDEFDGLYEAVAASYNGGEDNAARWMQRSNLGDAGLFVAEIGFAETKAYVIKVMTNYRIYLALYSEALMRK